MAIVPYLTFAGDCREALTRYREIFGGRLQFVARADLPRPDEHRCSDPEDIVHAVLEFDGHQLMASDEPAVVHAGPGPSVQVTYSTADETEARRVFLALADGGIVSMAMQETTWSARLGLCVDRYGIRWMVHVEPGEAGSARADEWG